MKKPYSFKLEPDIIPILRDISNQENRSLNNLVEKILIDFIELRGALKTKNLPSSRHYR
jgi:hypothetical protein